MRCGIFIKAATLTLLMLHSVTGDNATHSELSKRGRKKQALSPHSLPQCTKAEPGCEHPGLTIGKAFELLDPITYAIDELLPVFKAWRNSVTVKLYKPTGVGTYCKGGSPDSFYGGEDHHKIHIQKQRCHTWKMQPIQDLSFNYVTPENKVDNHCDLTFYDGKACTGEVVYQISGALELDMINGQSYCHLAPWAKSVMLGPCS